MEDLKLINLGREMLLSNNFVKTDNYYFQKHKCSALPQDSDEVRVDLDFKLKDERQYDITLMGICPHCKTVFYHNDIEKRKL